MNFFEHQARARAQSRWMMIAFILSVLMVVALVVAVLAVSIAVGASQDVALRDARLPRAEILAMAGFGVLAVITLASLVKISELKAGGGMVARSLGGTPVESATRDPRLRRLRNVVEEIAIASGVPVPEIYVLETEPGINAFAAGYAPSDAAVAVTRGALEKLDRDELQGVIAHEFSHILNGDMRLNIRLMGLVFGLLVIHIIGRELLRHTPRREKRGPTLALLGVGLLVAGSAGMFFGRLIKARISRQREYLADASAVQFTRQTRGLAGALKKIAGFDLGSGLSNGRGEEVSHMLFGDGFSLSFWFATHPPVIERIRRLEPGFSPRSLAALAAQINDPGYYVPDSEELPVSSLSTPSGSLDAGRVVSQVAHPGADDYRYAEQLHATLPAELDRACHDPRMAPAVLLALLCDREEGAVLERQLALLREAFGAPLANAARHCRQAMVNLHPAQRLPLASMAFPALRAWPPQDLERLISLSSELSHADGRVCPFEFALGRLLRVQIADWLAPAEAGAGGRRRLAGSEDAIAALLSALASAGNPEPEAARRAFASGWNHLYPRLPRRHQAAPDWGSLEAALNALDELLAPAKQLLVEALVQTLGYNGRVTVGEAELLRVACASLHCPLPPALGGILPVGGVPPALRG
ncbi:MAG: M48 family metallopeptidase [Stagnimonas sp.]|nr:M48 family metallopeptidase [Stagnimonas sp.]